MALLALLLLVILWILVLPVLFFLAGVIVAVSAFLSRLLSLETWSVEAKAEERRLVWRVQGLLRSARAVRAVAAALERGESPLVDGKPPDVVEGAPV